MQSHRRVDSWTPQHFLDVQRCSKHNVTSDGVRGYTNLVSKLVVSDRCRRITQLAQQLVQPPCGPDQGPLKDVGHVADLLQVGEAVSRERTLIIQRANYLELV